MFLENWKPGKEPTINQIYNSEVSNNQNWMFWVIIFDMTELIEKHVTRV